MDKHPQTTVAGTTSSDLAALVRNAIEGSFVFEAQRDEVSATWQFRLAETNSAGAHLVHNTPENVVGLTLREIMQPDRASTYQQRFASVFETQQPMQIEEFAEVYGTPTRVRQQIVPLPQGIFIQAQDITEQYEAETRLRNSESYLSSVVNNAPIILYELDRDGVFQLSTGRSLEHIGLDINEAVGQNIRDFFDAGSQELDAFRRALTGESVSTESALDSGYFSSKYTPRYDTEGNIIGVLGVSFDITDRRKTEEQLQRAQRMEAVGQLTGGIAHDFNNLLAVILGNLDLMAEKDDLSAENQEFVEQALAAAHRGANLTKRLLAFSRQQLLDPRATDANHLIELMLRLLNRTLPESIEINFAPQADLWLMQVDPSQLENAILNLCVNARDAMPQGGKLTLTTHNVSISQNKADELEISPGDYVTIDVADTGKGIEEAMLSIIFEPFFTTKETGKGSGLGLSMVYGFIEQSQGAITVESSPGVGSTFTLYLPKAMRSETAAIDQLDPSNTALRGQQEMILVVEDDSSVRQFVVKALLNLNYQVLEAKDGNEALYILDQGKQIDLLFSDIVLPGGLSGVGLAAQASAAHEDLRVLLTTGYARESGEDEDFSLLDEFEVLPKPYRIEELAKKVRQVLITS